MRRRRDGQELGEPLDDAEQRRGQQVHVDSGSLATRPRVPCGLRSATRLGRGGRRRSRRAPRCRCSRMMAMADAMKTVE